MRWLVQCYSLLKIHWKPVSVCMHALAQILKNFSTFKNLFKFLALHVLDHLILVQIQLEATGIVIVPCTSDISKFESLCQFHAFLELHGSNENPPIITPCFMGRHDIQHNATQLNDYQYNATQNNDPP
jgi:hypothetical protein